MSTPSAIARLIAPDRDSEARIPPVIAMADASSRINRGSTMRLTSTRGFPVAGCEAIRISTYPIVNGIAITSQAAKSFRLMNGPHGRMFDARPAGRQTP